MANLTLPQKKQLGDILNTLADSIDLTETQYQIAIDRYTTIGKYLSDPTSLLYKYRPLIISQGSIRLGTAVRPLKEDAEFDVDLTCLLHMNTPFVQYDVKQLVWKRLYESKVYRDMLKEMRRCWRLKYAESSKFHLDIVPAVPDKYEWLISLGVPNKYAKHAINITDNERPNYRILTDELPKSNPGGYALWFLDIMKIEADRIRMELKAKLQLRQIEDVPDYKVRTPLQRGIQLMKRHRDIMFDGKEEYPISIIITTLAARSYEHTMKEINSNIFYDVILRMVELMPQFIENRNGIKWIPNPVNPLENFADKWKENKRKEDNFYKWHAAFLETLRSDRITNGLQRLGDHLKQNFGTHAVNRAFESIGNLAFEQRESGLLSVSPLGIVGNTGAVIKTHTFHGK